MLCEEGMTLVEAQYALLVSHKINKIVATPGPQIEGKISKHYTNCGKIITM